MPKFDLRHVPVVGVDAHLAAVQPAQLTASALRARFAATPVWEPEVSAEVRFDDRPVTSASVLIPVMIREQLTVLLTQRTDHLSTHSGQIAFPGGKADAQDPDAIATALREAQEEVGLLPQHIEVLGCLPIYATGSGFLITPVVGLVHGPFSLQPNPGEVAEVFEVPLAYLMNPAHHQRHAMEWAGQRREWFSMPYRDPTASTLTERFIWGATAGMLRNLYRFLSAGDDIKESFCEP